MIKAKFCGNKVTTDAMPFIGETINLQHWGKVKVTNLSLTTIELEYKGGSRGHPMVWSVTYPFTYDKDGLVVSDSFRK